MTKLVLLTNELIPVYKNEEGNKLVNARELHEWLGSGQEFTNWIKNRIQQYGFIESEDYTSFDNFIKREIGGTSRKEYIITLDMAKELSMVERTEKGKEARQYFIKCEEKLKEVLTKQLSPMELLEMQYKVIKDHDEKLTILDDKVETLSLTMNVSDGQAKTIKNLVHKRVKTLCFGDESNAYSDESTRKKVYSYVWKSLKDYLGVTVYHNILRKDYNSALDYVNKITLQGSLLRDVQVLNNQISFRG
jgi:anti-repressor protein